MVDSDPLDSTMTDMIFMSLSSQFRRQILRLIDEKNPLSESEFIPEMEGVDDIQKITILRHREFPYLDNAGFIDWNRESETITRGPNFEKIMPFLNLTMEKREEQVEIWRN